MKFSEIWYVDASQQKKMLQNNCFSILAFFGQKTVQIDKKWRKLSKSKPFDKIFWNLVCRCFPTQENSTKKYFLILTSLGLFVDQKTAKIDKKIKKIVKSIILPLLNYLINLDYTVYAKKRERCWNKRKYYKKQFFDFGIFRLIFGQKTAKILQKIKKIGKIQTVW